MLENARREAEHIDKARRRRTLSFSIVAALMAGAMARPAAVCAAEHKDTITGVADNDRPGGTGGYDPGYDIVSTDGTLHYLFAEGDTVTVRAAADNVYGLFNSAGSSPISLDIAGNQALELSAIRQTMGTWGIAVGINNTGNVVTVNGNADIYAQADDSVSGSGSAAIGVRSVADSAGTPGRVVFNGATDIHAYSPGYAQGVFASGRSTITFNGPTTILAQSRGTLDAVYNSNQSTILFNGDTSVSALSIWPSDNAHGIYNDNVGSRLTVAGKLTLASVAQGSTAFGVRNQGIFHVGGDSTVDVSSPRSAFGVANTHRQARMTWGGNLQIRVRGGSYVPFGNPVGISNDRSPGAFMRFDGAVAVDVASAAETYGISNTGTVQFASTTAPVSLAVASTCNGCAVYGIRNLGSVALAAGVKVATMPSGDGAAYSLWSVPLDTQNASISVNQFGGNTVQLDGDIVTATDPINGFVGSVNARLDTADSFLAGLVGGRQSSTSYSSGSAHLAFSGGAAWMPQGPGTLANDFGSGSLTLGGAGAIDMAGYWGRFAPSSVPAHSYRTLLVDSTHANGATVSLTDGARFALLSDITGKSGMATADRIVFGSGIKTFSATGTQGVSIVYDPVLDDTSWVDASAIRNGRSIRAASAIEIFDASAAAGGNARFSAVTGLAGEWSGTYENDLVRFAYVPQVELTDDGMKVVLTGIAIQGTGSGSAGESSGSSGASNPSAPGSSSGSPDFGNGGSGVGSGVGAGTIAGVLPSETVLTAADAADSLVNLWRVGGQASLQQVRNRLHDTDPDRSSVWASADAGDLTVNTAYSRRYRQGYDGVSVGADRSFALDASSGTVGLAAGRIRSTADYTLGRGELTGTSLGLYGSWVADGGAYLLLAADASSLQNRYTARDSEARSIAGKYRTRAARLHAEGGFMFKLAPSYYIEPQLGLSTGLVRASRHVTLSGVRIDQNELDVSFLRAGIAFGKTLQGPRLGNVYARASALHRFGDDMDITASKDGGSIVPDTPDRKRMEGEFVLGGDIGFGPKHTGVFFEASATTGGETKRDWAVLAGLRHSW